MQPIAVITGKVVHGNGLGRTVGMPTANLSPVPGTELPPEGVYASRVYTGGQCLIGVTNIGRRPTVDRDQRITVETNIHDFDRDIYGETLTLEVMYALRPTRKMESLDEVRDQVRKDMARAVSLLQR